MELVLKKMDTKRFKIALWKRYFDIGYGTLGFVKYLVALFGLSSLNVGATMTFGFIYLFFCLLFGRLWVAFGMYEAEIEVGNKFNLFVREMRKVYKA